MSAKLSIDTLAGLTLNKFLLLGFDPRLSNDDRLAALSGHVGMLAAFVVYEEAATKRTLIKHKLVDCGAFALGWLYNFVEGDECHAEAKPLILAERERQQTLYRTQPEKYLVIMDSPVIDDKRKLRVLIEELGEVAEAIDWLESARTIPARI